MSILDLCVAGAALASLVAIWFTYPRKRRFTITPIRRAPPIDRIPEGHYKVTDRNGTRLIRKR
jgi:hypothetical protein